MDEHGRERLERESWEWLHFAAQLPAKAINLTTPAAGGLIAGGRWVLTGYSLFNESTSAVSFWVYDGQDGNGKLVVPNQVPASGYLQENLPGRGILIDEGIYVGISGGVVEGSVFAIPLWKYGKTPPGY